MKFSTTFLALAALASAAPAAPAANPQDENSVPSEAILGRVVLSDEIIAWYSNDTSEFVFLNNTILQQAKTETSLGKREAWAWVKIWPGQPIWKRDSGSEDEAESLEKRDPWAWVKIWPGQPIWKRDSGSEEEEDSETLEKREAWAWVKIWPGQPIW